MPDPQEQAQAQPAAATAELSEFDALLNKEFKPKSDEAKSAVKLAVQTLAEQALSASTLISDNAIKTIEAIIAEIDRKLTEQINLILHHEDFKSLEGSWRGLHYLVNNTETGENLKIRVMNISKKDVSKTLKKFKGTAWDQSPLFKKLYEEEFGMPGGQPFGCLLGDYYFDHSAPDVEMLSGIAQISAAAHAPFISAAAPSLLNMETWQELANPRDLAKIFGTPAYAAWKSLRQSEDSRYLGLTMPRVLARMPYGAKPSPEDEFAFEEDAAAADHNKYVWTNAAYATAVDVTQSFKPIGELQRIGGAQSLQKPQAYDNPDATANANLAARLPYLFATCRFAHYLKCMVRDKIGGFASREAMEVWLNTWIGRFVDSSPTSTDEIKARFPLSEAKVVVEEDKENPGYYSSKFYLKPHYQLEGLTVSLRLVSKLPANKK